METSRPIHCNVTLLSVKSCGSFHRSARADTAKFEEPVNNRAVVSHVILALLFLVRIHVVWGDLLEEINVLVRVELCHFHLRGWLRTLQRRSRLSVARKGHDLEHGTTFTYIYFHMSVEVIMHDQVMGKSDSMRLHRVTDWVGIVANVIVVEVCDLARSTRSSVIEGYRAQRSG